MSIKLENVSYVYMAGTPYEKQAILNVTLEINKGEFVAIIGHTGSGKSTMIQHLNGLLKPSSGKVFVDDLLLNMKDKKSKVAANKVGMVFQYPEHQLFAETIFEDIAFGPRNIGFSADEVTAQVQRAMNFVGLDYEKFKDRSPLALSGGQMRRVAIAGVVAMNPDYLILDEPSAGLDPRTKAMIFHEIKNLYLATGIAVVLITHNMEEAALLSDRVIVMSGGKIILNDSPQNIFLNHREELQNAGLDVPNIIKLKDDLVAKGVKISAECISLPEVADSIFQGLGGKRL